MNQVFKIVWNNSLSMWIAVSELAKGKSKSHCKKTIAISAVTLVMSCALPALTQAGQALLGGNASSQNSIAIGGNAGGSIGSNIARGDGEITIGDGAQTGKDGVESSQSIAIGFDAKAQGDQSIALGANVRATGDSSVAIGGDDVDRLANNLDMNKKYEDLTGIKLVDKNYPRTTASGGGATAVGTQATASGDFSTALGMTSVASGTASSALGVYAKASGGAALAIGAISKAEAEQSIALGTNAKVNSNATNSIAIGNGAIALNRDSIAIGSGSKADSTTLSNEAYLVGGMTSGEMNIGNRRITDVSAGSDDTDAVNVSQLRQATLETINQGFALQAQDGGKVQKSLGAAVEVVGADSNISTKVDSDQIKIELSKTLNVESVTAGNTVLDQQGLSFNTAAGSKKGPSITATEISAGNYKITNVEAGVVSATSTDAVNGSQLFIVQEDVKQIISSGLAGVQKKFLVSSNGQEALEINDNATLDIGTDSNENNLKVSKNLNTIDFSLSKNLVLDSALFGATFISDEGFSFKDGAGDKIGPSVTVGGIDAGSQKITNVAVGEVSATSTDAVNGSQLNAVGKSTALSLGGTSKFDSATGQVTAGLIVGDTTYTTVQDALNQVNKTVNTGFNITTNGDISSASNVKPSNTIDFANTDNNINITNVGNEIKVDLNKDLNIESVTAGNSVMNSNGLTIKDQVGNSTILNESGLSFSTADGSKIGPNITASGIDAGSQKITNVAAGAVSATSTDAVNGSQLYNTVGAGAYDSNGNLNNIGGTGANNINDAIAAVTKNIEKNKVSVQAGSENVRVSSNDSGTVYTVDVNPDLNLNSVTTNRVDVGDTTVSTDGIRIKNGPSVTNKGIDAGSQKITNVAAGAVSETSTDAVNGSQLNTTNQTIGEYLGGGAGYDNITQSFNAPQYQVNGGNYNNVGDALGALNQADQALDNRINNLGDQLQQAFSSTNQRIDDVERKANAGIAAAMALETAPYIAGKYTYAAAAAYHGGENAVGVTLRKTADNGRWSLTGGIASGSAGSPSVRVGISGVIN